MALNNAQKQIAALLAKRNPTSEYMIRLSFDEPFALSEIEANKDKIQEELLKEKHSHESHIAEFLNPRLEEIATLLAAIEEIENGSE